ncbi:inositol monophosphatase family protein [Pontiellaceae bacterium B12219]|nr:inositol monophosphatase family protein [Pontiellaceae bacterium B12219]
MNDITLTHLLDVAVCAAEAAGKHAFENKDRRLETNENLAHDVKLVLDVECQKKAEAIIQSEFPDHGILGEEDEAPNHSSPYEWIIDPIDGTLNFSHGFEYWCSSIAVRKNQQVVAGCVYAPDFGSYYTAHIEDVAKLNGVPISVSKTNTLERSMIFTGLSKEMENTYEPHLDMFRELALNTKKVRINGAAALDLCRVADGTCDGFFETGIFLWDYVAGGLIAQQAGATMTTYPRKGDLHGATALCSNEHLIEGLQAIYTKCI